MNRLSALQCAGCSMPFSSLPPSAFVETETAQDRVYSTFDSEMYAPLSYQSRYEEPNELGRKTFFWYRVYCGVLAALYALIAVMGLFISYMAPGMGAEATENMFLGLVYAVVGTIFFAVFLVASILPPKPYNWIVGIIMIAIGMTSCCMWPAVIPLLIYWIKPETREFFGRK
jgi:lipopolysaccharide export LptBFGC system permease protein LptF